MPFTAGQAGHLAEHNIIVNEGPLLPSRYGTMGTSDDAATINAAITAAAATTGTSGGEVYIPRGLWYVSSVLLKSGVTLRGAGQTGTQLIQVTGTAGPVIKSATPASALTRVAVRDLMVNGFVNQTSGLGGITFEGIAWSLVHNVRVAGCKGFGIKILGGTAQGDAMHNIIDSCQIDNIPATGAVAAIQVTPTTGGGSHPDGTRIVNNALGNASGAGILVDPPTGDFAGWLGADSCTIMGNTIQSAATPIDMVTQGTRVIGNRMEITSGSINIYVRAGTTNYPSIDNSFVANTVAAPTSITFNDAGLHTTRLAENWTGSIIVQQMGARYTTAARPSAATIGVGGYYYDTTLSKPGFSNGTVWKDAAGTTI